MTWAAECVAPNDMRIVERPVPPLEPGDELLRVEAAGICGTDVRIFRGRKTRGVKLPRVLGHEIAGRLDSAGKPVVVLPTVVCGGCWACRAGQEHLCEQRLSFGYAYDGGFAQLMRVPALAFQTGSVLPMPPGLSAAAGAMVEPVACCLLAHRLLGPDLESPVLIAGAGPMGLLHLLLARRHGLRVLVSEPRAARRERALALGAAASLDPIRETLRDQFFEQTGGEPPHAVIVATASPDALAASLQLVRRGGAIHLFSGYDEPALLDMRRVHNDEVRVVGHSGYDQQDARQALQLIASGDLDPEALISHRFPLARIADALEVAESRSGFKVLVEPQAGVAGAAEAPP